MKKRSKRAQITIFIVVGILLISSVALFFIIRGGDFIPTITDKPEENPDSFLKLCITDKVREAVDFLGMKGGYVDNSLSLEFQFQGEEPANLSYLCYNQNNYFPCINQRPALLEDFEEEIKLFISADVQDCFNEMTGNFELEYETNVIYNDLEVEVLPGKILILTDSEIELTKGGETTINEDLSAVFSSRIYEVIKIVEEIVNQEAEYCYAENLGISLLYPQFITDKFITTDSIKIYTIKHRETTEMFRFAVRSCVIPPGI